MNLNKWKYSDFENVNDIERLMTELNISKVLAKLLLDRGIKDFNSAKSFFRPNLENLHDPFLMKGMKEAVQRVTKAISNNENILIYGDYDVDGTTSVAMMVQYLNNFSKQIEFYIPDRYAEGYGVSKKGVDFAIDNNFSLIISLDCGIKAIEMVAYAKSHNIDFIVCDHHTPDNSLPEAIILNPKQENCDYPFKDLCGCGVGFKLIQALNIYNDLPFSDIEPLLELVMVAIGADMVSVMGENRILAYHGLKWINSTPRLGFKILLDLAKKKGELSITDIVFSIAPRINAAGRIESGNRAVDLLLASNIDEAKAIGTEIDNYNSQRRIIEKDITKHALEIIKSDQNLINKSSTVIYDSSWHKGVIGIVASRLIEHYYKPTIVLTESKGMLTGSARSVSGFNLYDALHNCKELLDQFGGHKYAAGLTLKKENINLFANKFELIVKKHFNNKELQPEIKIDGELDFRDIFENGVHQNPKFYRVLKQFAPFGPNNMSPIFLTKSVKNRNSPQILKDEHLKLNVFQNENENNNLQAIGFNMAEFKVKILNKPFDILYHLEENNWNGNRSLQLILKDIKV